MPSRSQIARAATMKSDATVAIEALLPRSIGRTSITR